MKKQKDGTKKTRRRDEDDETTIRRRDDGSTLGSSGLAMQNAALPWSAVSQRLFAGGREGSMDKDFDKRLVCALRERANDVAHPRARPSFCLPPAARAAASPWPAKARETTKSNANKDQMGWETLFKDGLRRLVKTSD
ncbi:hypothetical protein XA68_15965 [Ophiocordyceps unilateralis]|uniref:Uncharacterized protein n=1 Tax=Ophiocordyceps unilateralis TaxID=268505 RepID=A0A2A9P7E4_OPHUN|nr:hypothetical protein XA68_15965 [Ophiocordyceps unilateralis]